LSPETPTDRVHEIALEALTLVIARESSRVGMMLPNSRIVGYSDTILTRGGHLTLRLAFHVHTHVRLVSSS
jgi:hypothetical protein